MAPQSRRASEGTMKREATASPLSHLSDLPDTRDVVGNQAIEAALKEITAQLRSNKKHLKKLRREVKDNKKDMNKLCQEVHDNMKKLLQGVQDSKNEIEKYRTRIDAMAYNNMARVVNQNLKDDFDELLPIRNH